VTIFLSCGFAAKYRAGGGNFSVPLQWMLGLRRLGLDAVWLELVHQAPGDRVHDPEGARLRERGWHVVSPHRVARTPRTYRRYVSSALGESTAIKGVDVAWRTGWVSDRAAAFLALGRPVITEDTGARKYLSRESGFRFVNSIDEVETAANEVLADWTRLSKQARNCAVETFDSAKNLRKILGLAR
jgi:hypothetical protein